METIPGSSPLMDTIAVVIGFAAVMLLLSLIVTTVVQMIQSMLGLRPKNLAHALAGLLESVIPVRTVPDPDDGEEGEDEEEEEDGEEGEPESVFREKGEAVGLAKRVLNMARFAPGRDRNQPDQIKRDIFEPAASWIERDELIHRLDELDHHLNEDQRRKLTLLYGRMADHMSKRLTLHIRYVTVLVAFAVAFVFQVNAPQLIHDLSTKPELREQGLLLSDELLEKEEEYLGAIDKGAEVPEKALAELALRYPDLEEKLEEASGADNRSDTIREMALVLEGEPRADEVIREYRKILDGLYSAQIKEARSRIIGHADQLALMDIVPWKGGWGFYCNVGNWFGVIVSAFLISLGAPFWYQVLRNASSLRDALKGQKERKERAGKEAGDPAAAGARGAE